MTSGADSHISDACSGSGTLMTRLRQCSWCSTQRHDSSTICDRTTTSRMRWRHCTGCTSQNVCSTKLRCYLSKCFTTARHNIWDLLSPSPTYLVGELCGQQVPAA